MKNKKYGVCAICGNEAKMSYDHVPPQNVGNKKDIYYIRMVPEFLVGNAAPIHSQNGIKLQYICEKCNAYLGTKYDIVLPSFVEKFECGAKKGYPSFIEKKTLYKVIKSIIGHFLASGEFEQSVPSQDLRIAYYNDDISSFCSKYTIQIFYYPFESIFIHKNYISKIDNDMILLSSLYFPNIALIFTEKRFFKKGTDLLSLYLNGGCFNNSIKDWSDNKHYFLPKTWPCIIDGYDFVLASHHAKNSIVVVNKPTKTIKNN